MENKTGRKYFKYAIENYSFVVIEFGCFEYKYWRMRNQKAKD